MIQRIQTVFLLFAFLLTGILFFVPFASFLPGNGYGLSLSGIEITGNIKVKQPEWLIFLGSATLTLIFGTIFLFKKRKMQMRLTIAAIIMALGLNAYMYLVVQHYHSLLNAEIKYGFVFVFPLISAILLWLAYRAINKDEQLIRSLDRLR